MFRSKKCPCRVQGKTRRRRGPMTSCAGALEQAKPRTTDSFGCTHEMSSNVRRAWTHEHDPFQSTLGGRARSGPLAPARRSLPRDVAKRRSPLSFTTRFGRCRMSGIELGIPRPLFLLDGHTRTGKRIWHRSREIGPFQDCTFCTGRIIFLPWHMCRACVVAGQRPTHMPSALLARRFCVRA